MPRETWRDHPEYRGLWRMTCEQPGEPTNRLVLADWLDEYGDQASAWRHRLHALTGDSPTFDPDTKTVRAGLVAMAQGAWRALLAAPPPDDLLCVFKRDVQAYQYLRQFRGRCGWDLGQSVWSSGTERAHLLAVPRLEMLGCKLVGPDSWDWALEHLSGLTHFEADGPMVEPARLARLHRLPRLRSLVLKGKAAGDLTALEPLPGLRHLAIGPYYFGAAQLAALAPEVVSLHADPCEIGTAAPWPRLRSLMMLPPNQPPYLTTEDIRAITANPLLERLSLRCGELTAEATEALARLPALSELTLRFNDAPVPPLAALSEAASLESLTIEGSVGEASLHDIGRLPQLRRLTLTRVGSDRGLEALTALGELEELSLVGDSDGVSKLLGLAALPRLERLDFRLLNMPARAAEAVKAACPPGVECLVPDDAV